MQPVFQKLVTAECEAIAERDGSYRKNATIAAYLQDMVDELNRLYLAKSVAMNAKEIRAHCINIAALCHTVYGQVIEEGVSK